MADPGKLRRGLSARQLSMISIGGVIGVGMFLGSGATVKLAGPGVVLAYALGGIVMMLVMYALGEMSVAQPSPGSFRLYASEQLGPYAGFITGWMYWLSWVVVMAAEVVAATTYTRLWFDQRVAFALGLLFALAMTWVNLQNVTSFGEFEFWFSLVKVVAILVFVGVGAALVLGLGPLPAIGLTNYTGQGGFLPNGIRGLGMSMALVMVAYGGTEVIGVAAAETRDPERNVPLAIRGIILRTLVLYIGSIAVLVGVIPWNQVGLAGSPFVMVFNRVGIPAAGTLMNLVVITAALSSMNSGLYTSSRVLFSLAREGMCSQRFTRLDPKTRVPGNAVLASAAGLYVGVLAYRLSPGTAFVAITSIASFGFMLVWLIISLSHLRFHKSMVQSNPGALKYVAPGYPYASATAALILVGVISVLWFIPEQRIGVLGGLATLGVVSFYYLVTRRFFMTPKSRPAESLRLASFFGLDAEPPVPGDTEREGSEEPGSPAHSPAAIRTSKQRSGLGWTPSRRDRSRRTRPPRRRS